MSLFPGDIFSYLKITGRVHEIESPGYYPGAGELICVTYFELCPTRNKIETLYSTYNFDAEPGTTRIFLKKNAPIRVYNSLESVKARIERFVKKDNAS